MSFIGWCLIDITMTKLNYQTKLQLTIPMNAIKFPTLYSIILCVLFTNKLFSMFYMQMCGVKTRATVWLQVQTLLQFFVFVFSVWPQMILKFPNQFLFCFIIYINLFLLALFSIEKHYVWIEHGIALTLVTNRSIFCSKLKKLFWIYKSLLIHKHDDRELHY